MEVAILTVGDEVLAGDIANSNAHWLASRLTETGAAVRRILTVPDDRDLIAATVARWTAEFDAVIVTGGLGGTHDDVTADAIADAVDRTLSVDDVVREDVVTTVAEYRDLDPTTVTEDDIDFDVEAWAALPAGSRVLLNPEGLCPGFVVDGVYAFPGVPDEMQAIFEQVANEFSGEAVSTILYTPQPEASMASVLASARDRFSVTVGSYPATETDNRLKVTGTDSDAVSAAVDWLRERIEITEQ